MAYTRIRRNLEPRWVSEYTQKFYPGFEHRPGCPLGGIPKETERDYGLLKGLRVYRPWRPEVDMAIRLPNLTLLVEAKIFKYMDGLSKLPVYKSMLGKTPELRSWPQEVKMHLLIPARIPWVIEAAQEPGIIVLFDFVPDYIREEWERRDRYWTKEALERREERKRILREAGMP